MDEGEGVRSREGSFGIHAASSLFLAPARAPRSRPSPTAHAHSPRAGASPPLPPSLLGSTVGHINPSPSLPSCRTEEVAVPQQPYQNHSSCYLPSFLPWLVLHVWHLAVSRPLSGGLRLDGDPFLTWDATTRRSRSRIAVFPLIASSPSHPPRLRFSLPRQNMRPAREDGDDDGMPGPAGHARRPVNDIPRDRSLPHFMRCPCVDGQEHRTRVDIMFCLVRCNR